MRKNVKGFERLASVTAGAALLFLAARRAASRRLSKTFTALGLLGRGTTGFCPVNSVAGRSLRSDDPREALSGDRGIRIEESVTIQASPHALFEFWRKPDNLVRVFPHLERVEPIDDMRSHWVMGGPGGTTVEWDARIINEIPGEKIAWESLPGSKMVSAGSVTFRPLPRGGTDVSVVMQYDLPTGKLGAALAWLVGRSPDTEVREALRRLKQGIETGHTPSTSGRPTRPTNRPGSPHEGSLLAG